MDGKKCRRNYGQIAHAPGKPCGDRATTSFTILSPFAKVVWKEIFAPYLLWQVCRKEHPSRNALVGVSAAEESPGEPPGEKAVDASLSAVSKPPGRRACLPFMSAGIFLPSALFIPFHIILHGHSLRSPRFALSTRGTSIICPSKATAPLPSFRILVGRHNAFALSTSSRRRKRPAHHARSVRVNDRFPSKPSALA